MKHAAANVTEGARDWIAWILAAIGVTFPTPDYLGGLIWALAGASLAARMNRDKDDREYWMVLSTAAFVATIGAALIHQYWPDLPPQPVMAVLGFGSRFVVATLLRITGRIEDRSEDIADGALKKIDKDS